MNTIMLISFDQEHTFAFSAFIVFQARQDHSTTIFIRWIWWQLGSGFLRSIYSTLRFSWVPGSCLLEGVPESVMNYLSAAVETPWLDIAAMFVKHVVLIGWAREGTTFCSAVIHSLFSWGHPPPPPSISANQFPMHRPQRGKKITYL